MKEEMAIRNRFYKPYHFLAKVGKVDSSCLSELFKSFHLYEFKDEINLWQRLALSNNQSAYDDGYEREDLIDFVEQLHKLVEAFYIINTKINLPEKKRRLKRWPKKTKKILSKMNIPALLTEEEKTRPGLVVKQFCKTFRQPYAKMELLDMLDAVVTSEGDKKPYKGTLVLFYQHIHCLIKLAYHVDKHKSFIKNLN